LPRVHAHDKPERGMFYLIKTSEHGTKLTSKAKVANEIE
jgi:hypothetical protein